MKVLVDSPSRFPKALITSPISIATFLTFSLILFSSAAPSMGARASSAPSVNSLERALVSSANRLTSTAACFRLTATSSKASSMFNGMAKATPEIYEGFWMKIFHFSISSILFVDLVSDKVVEIVPGLDFGESLGEESVCVWSNFCKNWRNLFIFVHLLVCFIIIRYISTLFSFFIKILRKMSFFQNFIVKT